MGDSKTYGNSERLFTIGYEGKNVIDFFTILICSGITTLCDVRKNAISRKPGFSKKALRSFCQKFSIEYRHFPELGIDSQLRKNLHTQEDYINLFKAYQHAVLANTIIQQRQLLEDIQKGKTIALMCFEKDPKMCHRSRLAEAISVLASMSIRVVNL